MTVGGVRRKLRQTMGMLAFGAGLAGVPGASASAAAVPQGAAVRVGVGALPSIYGDATPPVFASATPLPEVARWVAQALSVRAAKLDQLSTRVAGTKALASSTRAALSGVIASDQAGMAELSTTSSGATSLVVLDGVAASMITNYRVFAVVVPVVQLSIEATSQTKATSALVALEPAIEAAITTDHQGGKSVARVRTVYRQLTIELAMVASIDTAETAAVDALRPASYPGSTGVLTTATMSLASASTRLVVARADLRRIVKLLEAPKL